LEPSRKFREREREFEEAFTHMKTTQTKPPILRKCFLLSLLLSLPFFLVLLSLRAKHHHQNTTDPPPEKQSYGSGDLKIRPGYPSYKSYIQRQLKKTLNPKLRELWTTRDWDRKIQVFAIFFQDLKQKRLLSNESKALCIGARVGQEVEALRRIGVSDSVGIDLVPSPPLVMRGDFHNQPFDNETFDFEFSNVFDHALYPDRFVAEIERTLKPGGVCVLHVALSRRSDKYSANDLYSVKPLVEMFKGSEVVHIRGVDGFGLDTEVVFRKKRPITRS
jgi:SAM-dependent methyltransferase